MVWNLFPVKGDFSFGKSQKSRVPNLGCRGAESPGWFDVSPTNSAGDVMQEQACCPNEAANHQLPIAAAFWIIWIVSMEECSSLMQNVMQIHCSTFCPFEWDSHTDTCSLNSVYRFPLTSAVKLSSPTHARSSPLSLAARLNWCQTNHSRYTNHGWTFSGQTFYRVCSLDSGFFAHYSCEIHGCDYVQQWFSPSLLSLIVLHCRTTS